LGAHTCEHCTRNPQRGSAAVYPRDIHRLQLEFSSLSRPPVLLFEHFEHIMSLPELALLAQRGKPRDFSLGHLYCYYLLGPASGHFLRANLEQGTRTKETHVELQEEVHLTQDYRY